MKYEVLVREIMSRKINRVDGDDPIDKAAQVMRETKSGYVVIGEAKIKGIVTTSDIVYKHVAEHSGAKVSDIMSTNPITITADKTIEEAARLMAKHNVEKLLVFELDKLVGVIGSNDILKIEPALIEVLLERLKMGQTVPEDRPESGECEICSNFSDDLRERRGVWICAECDELE